MNISKSSLITSKKFAIIVSYVGLVLHTFSNLLLTPLYLKFLGTEMYGIYQMVYSMAHYILILDIGISTTMVRYISDYRAKEDKQGEKNVAAHCFGIALIVMVLIVIAGIIINHFLTDIYPAIPAKYYDVSHNLFLAMIATLVGTIFERFLEGIVMAYEHFTVVKALSAFKIVLKIGLTLVLLYTGFDVSALVITDLAVEVFVIAFLSIYAFGILKFRFAFLRFDVALLLSIFSFMLAILLQSIVSYINNLVDKTILGIITTAQDVAVYSVATTFITMFNSLPTVISNVFLPQATRLLNNNPDRKTLTNFVSRPGRYQFMLCGALICGFILFGREFITLWVGKDSLVAWEISLVIMIPNMIPLVQNTVVCVLDAKKKRLFRSVSLFIMSMIHILISTILVYRFGIMGAPIGSAVSYLIGYGLILNIYYHKKIGIDVPRLFRTIFSKTWLCILISGVVSLPLNFIFTNASWVTLAIKVLFFCCVYFLLLFIYGFNSSEKNDIGSIIKRFIR